MNISLEPLPPCVICGKIHLRCQIENYVYHASKGVVCTSHKGVAEWYKEELIKAGKRLTEGAV